MKGHVEKRQTARVRMEIPVQLQNGTGVTRDVSPSGVFFLTDRKYSPGVSLTFTLELDYAFPGEQMHLHCRGKVVRVESMTEKFGIAASISEFWSF
jgi:hypothetical protein